ncbi:MAG: NAD(P)H-hydrate dehydratase [Candidatus Eisenbacteria bacterium]
MRVLTAAQMRAVDQATIEAGHAAGDVLMERAGQGVADALERHFGSPLALHVLVLCGAGNNGGDGFVAARHLHARGAVVRVGLLAAAERVRGDARLHLSRLESAGVGFEVCDTREALELLVHSRTWEHAIDALLGTGASGEPHGLIAAACEALNRLRSRHVRVTAVDLPTGVDADTGAVSQKSVQADLTVTFGAAKRGHVLYPGRAWRGELEVVDIGLLPTALEGASGVTLAHPRMLAGLLARRNPRAHKGDAGRVVIVGGSAGMTGAVVLAAQAASRAGAGYVRVCAPASVQDVLAAHLVEQMVVPCGEDQRRALTTSALPQLRAEAARADAVVLGPGFSRHPYALELVREVLPHLDLPVVVDADALFALSPAAQHLKSACAGDTHARILTPHVLEMERLTGVPSAEIEARRIDIASEWGRRWGCIVVLKGAPTVITEPSGRTCVNPTGNAGMATAGMGDVLAGAIGALLAQGLPAYEAACLGVFAHGWAGDLAQQELGETGLVARDVVERLPRTLQRVRGSATCD